MASFKFKRIWLLFFYMFCLTILFSCFRDMCGNEIVKEVISPDKKNKIVIFARDCGATTDFATEISLIKNGENLSNSSGNIFDADDKNGAQLDSNNIINVKVEWLASNRLKIEYAKYAKIYKLKNKVAGIEIEYNEIPDPIFHIQNK